jgi:LemA protein
MRRDESRPTGDGGKMKKGYIILIVVGILLIAGYMTLKNSYNNFVILEEGVNQKWAQVENVYQRRADLIPNLVEVVKGYAGHERETLEAGRPNQHWTGCLEQSGSIR